MSVAGSTEYVPDVLYERLFQPWKIHPSEWPLCKEDWARVDAVSRLPWRGRLLDVGAGDGTLAAMVCSRNPDVVSISCVEPDPFQHGKGYRLWSDWPLRYHTRIEPGPYDGVMLCEVLEHLTVDRGEELLSQVCRTLQKGARVCATVPCDEGSRATYTGHIRAFRQGDLRDLLEHQGFGKVIETDLGGVWYMVTAIA